MCNCGCNTCETKSNGPLLTESKVKSLLSEGLQYHIDKKIPLFETVYRIGSDKHLALIKEARKMYSRNVIDLCEEDEALIKTHLGEFGIYEGVSVPLDLPMIDESDSNYPDFDLNKNIRYQDTSISSGMWRYTGQEQGGKGVYRNLNNGQILAFDRSDFDIFRNNLSSHFDISESLNESKYDTEETIQQTIDRLKARIEDPNDGGNVSFLIQKIKDLEKSLSEATVDYNFSKEELIRVIKQLKRGASTEIGMIKAFEKALGRELTDDEIRGFKLNEAQNSLLKQNKLSSSEYQKAKKLKGFNKDNYKWNADEDLYVKLIDEAEFRGKDVPLNKPKRGGSKAYYVYVRDPKTKKIKKVSFGSGGLRAKIKNKEARNAFAKRHRCKDKKDRTKAGYWSCRLPYYAKILGLGQNMQTFW